MACRSSFDLRAALEGVLCVEIEDMACQFLISRITGLLNLAICHHFCIQFSARFFLPFIPCLPPWSRRARHTTVHMIARADTCFVAQHRFSIQHGRSNTKHEEAEGGGLVEEHNSIIVLFLLSFCFHFGFGLSSVKNLQGDYLMVFGGKGGFFQIWTFLVQNSGSIRKEKGH